MNAGFLRRRGVITRHPVDFYAERCAYGFAGLDGTATTDQFVALYNDDPLGRYLRVFSLAGFNGSNANQNTVRVYNGQLGTLVMHGRPLVTNLAQPPGSIYAGAATSEVGDAWGSGGLLPLAAGITPAPLVVLAQGFSFILYAGGAFSPVGATFIWMVD
jgi:hypothetical protein